MKISLTDDKLTWKGAIELEHGEGWAQPWRLPPSQLSFGAYSELKRVAAMPAGVRLAFDTDADAVRIALQITGIDPLRDRPRVDFWASGRLLSSASPNDDGVFECTGLGNDRKSLEIWLPQFGETRVLWIEVASDSGVWDTLEPGRRNFLVHGSSISQCRQAGSPSSTWPALVATRLDLDLTCLGFSGECFLDPIVPKAVHNMRFDYIHLCLGINIYGSTAFSPRSFLPAAQGFVAAIRSAHPEATLTVMSPIASDTRESVTGACGMSLQEMRAQLESLTRFMQEEGDSRLTYLDGLEVLSLDQTDLLEDGLHPSAHGYEVMALAIGNHMDTLIGAR